MALKARVADVVADLRRQGSPKNVAGMARYGIRPEQAFGVTMPTIRAAGKALGTDHGLGLALYDTGIREPRMVGALVVDPDALTVAEMEHIVAGFDSWDVCDHWCGTFRRSPRAWGRARTWTRRRATFTKRAGFSLAAQLVVEAKDAPDGAFRPFLAAVEREAHDDRNDVKKAVSWALRGIGKGRPGLIAECRAIATRLTKRPESSARWIGRDALRDWSGRF